MMLMIEYGWTKLVSVQEVRDGRLYLGGYSIRYDQNNNEVSRTPVTWNGCWNVD